MEILEIYHKKECHNPLSGHSWTELTTFSHYEVCGGWFQRTKHRSRAAAEKELEQRKAFNKKFPFVPPLSRKESQHVANHINPGTN